MSGIYQFDPEDAKRFGREQGIEFRTRGNELQFKRCPYCRNNTNDKDTFAISLRTGQFKCLRATCGAHGNMITLAKDFGFSLGRDVDEYYNSQKRYRNIHRKNKPLPTPVAITYLEGRMISKATAERYNITCQREHENVLVFPFYDENDILQFVKYRKTDFDKDKDKNKEWCEANCKPILFGMNQCDMEHDTLIMTEGQIDSLSVAECGIKNAVSVPTGAKGFTWVPYCWDFLARFKRLVIFGDHEHGHITLLDDMKSRFRHGTVLHVREEDYKDCKDANELLRKYGKKAVIDAVVNAIPVDNPHIRKIADVRRVDMSQLECFASGIPALDRITGGMFFGRLMLLTGERGKGKSTLGSQFGIFAIKAGYNVFYYSGELTDWNVQDWFERQIAGNGYINRRISKDRGTFYSVDQQYIHRIASWYGEHAFLYSNDILNDSETGENETILQTMEKAITQYACKMLIVDNLMTALEDDLSSDLYRQQTAFMTQLAKMAKRYDVLILLIAHPKKEQGNDFSNDSISGTGNITNLCDVVMRYDEPKKKRDGDEKPERILQVFKNRMNGKVDRDGIPLYFQESSKRISQNKDMFDWKMGWEDIPDFEPIEEDALPFGDAED